MFDSVPEHTCSEPEETAIFGGDLFGGPAAARCTHAGAECGYCERCESTGPFDARDDAATQALDAGYQEFLHDE